MTDVAPAPNLGSEIDEHSFIERPRVFQAFLMKGRMFCCGEATGWGAAGATCGAATGACASIHDGASERQRVSRRMRVRDFPNSDEELRIEECMTPDYSLWLIILQRTFHFQLGAHLLDTLDHQGGHAVLSG